MDLHGFSVFPNAVLWMVHWLLHINYHAFSPYCSVNCHAMPQDKVVPVPCNQREWSTPLCDIPSGCCSFMGPWTVTRSSLRMLRRVATFCRPLRPVLLLVSFPRSRSPVVGVLGLC